MGTFSQNFKKNLFFIKKMFLSKWENIFHLDNENSYTYFSQNFPMIFSSVCTDMFERLPDVGNPLIVKVQ